MGKLIGHGGGGSQWNRIVMICTILRQAAMLLYQKAVGD